MKVILGIKKGMTQVYSGDKAVPVSMVDCSSCVVSAKSDAGVELGLGEIKASKALAGKYKELGYVPRYRVYFKGSYDLNVGDKVVIDSFEDGAKLVVSGKTKGKGFAGVVKRHGFAGGPKTHGQSDRHRAPGSIGAGTDPGRVLKGKKMPGRMGSENVTVKGKKVVKKIENIMMVSGPVPGNRGDLVIISEE